MKYPQGISVSCFYETFNPQVSDIQFDVSNKKGQIPVKRIGSAVEFVLDPQIDVDAFPVLNIRYTLDLLKINKKIYLYVPINKYIIPISTNREGLTKYLEQRCFSLTSDLYPLDHNYFKTINELRFIFRKFLKEDMYRISGLFKVTGYLQPFHMRIECNREN